MDHCHHGKEANNDEVDSDLAELDRILAELGVTTRDKNATIFLDQDSPETQRNRGLPLLREQSTPVVSIDRSLTTTLPTRPSVTPVPDLPYKRSASTQATIDRITPALDKPWRSQWPLERLASSFVVAQQKDAFAFTLALSPTLQNTLVDRDDPARLMSHYINREMKRHLGVAPAYSFLFEVSAAGRLHLHGVIIPTNMNDGRRNAIKNAIAAAGGRLSNAPVVRASQCHLTPIHDGLGWFGYISKSYDDTEGFLGTHKISFIATSLKRLCREAHATPGRRAHQSPDEKAATIRKRPIPVLARDLIRSAS